MSETFGEALARLRKEADKGSREDRPPSLPVDEIALCPAVFQPREGGAASGDMEPAHVAELVRAVRTKPADAPWLDPIMVTAVGQHFYCIDGHHRAAAYRRAEITQPVPVEHFEGSLEEAIAEARRQNAKVHLTMNMWERQNAAWHLVWLGKFTKEQEAAAAGVGKTTIAKMRALLRRLREAHPGEVWDSYREALEADAPRERREFTEEHLDAMIDDWARRLGKTFGKQAGRHPEAFAEALDRFSPRLFERLAEINGYRKVPDEEWGF
jgi:hypothetical protein